MLLTAWATLAVLGVYFWTGVMAGWARVKYKVPAPSMDRFRTLIPVFPAAVSELTR